MVHLFVVLNVSMLLFTQCIDGKVVSWSRQEISPGGEFFQTRSVLSPVSDLCFVSSDVFYVFHVDLRSWN